MEIGTERRHPLLPRIWITLVSALQQTSLRCAFLEDRGHGNLSLVEYYDNILRYAILPHT
jgi:hypothetical protein